MYINETCNLIRKSDGSGYLLNMSGNSSPRVIKTDDALYPKCKEVYDRALTISPSERSTRCKDIVDSLISLLGSETTAETVKETIPADKLLLRGLENMIKFFTEFQFEPNFRFVNSYSQALAKSEKLGNEYIKNYFELIDSPYVEDIKAKITSAEFKNIAKDIKAVAPTKVVNERFKLYYGSQGTGKTTMAMQEADNRCMVCNSALLPNDLMEDFVFVDGKASFVPSILAECMAKGLPIVLDEINLLPFDSLRFLQTILDGKEEFIYKGKTIKIAKGFQIIGTMNLTVNGMTYGLPEPLVDRCAETRKFSLSAKDLVSAIC